MSVQRLDLLPIEIIRRILALGPCTNALTLLCVSRALRSICSDPVIYTSIIYNSNGIALADHSTAVARWPLLQSLRTEQDWQICARYALADMYLNVSTSGGAQELQESSVLYAGCWKWLPGLIVTGHQKAITNGVTIIRTSQLRIPINQIERQLSELSTQPVNGKYYNEIAIRLIFIAVCDSFVNASSPTRRIAISGSRLHTRQATLRFHFDNSSSWLIEKFLPMLIGFVADCSLFPRFSVLERTNMLSTWLTQADQDRHWFRCMVLCVLMTPVMFECMARSMASSSSHPDSGMEFDAFLGLPPIPIEIPFHDLYELEQPFADASTMAGLKGFATRHLSKMTSAKFLEDGKWCGYLFPEAIHKDKTLAVHNLSIRLTSDCPDHCTVTGQCERLTNGYMTLTGTLFKQTGWAQLDAIVEGLNGSYTAIPLSVMVTPFGIVGSWKMKSNAYPSSQAGWAWLWKKSWSKWVDPNWRRAPDTVLDSS